VSNSKGLLNAWPAVIATLAIVVTTPVLELTFMKELASDLNTVSAWLCETLTNGLGLPVEKIASRVQSVNPANAFKLEFTDGGWILKQFYLLLPMTLFFNFVFKLPMWKLYFVGLVATLCGICVRALLLGYNAALYGQQTAEGWLDTIIRAGCMLFVMLAMVGFSAKDAKPVTSKEHTPV